MVRVGVTGHRILTAIDKVVAGIDTAIDRIGRKFAGDVQVAVSSLAEGADRLAAQRILAAGGRLIVPLPLPPSDYADDFGSDASKHEFRQLLGRADEVIDPPPRATRPDAYRAAGQYVVENCDVLIAVWDGSNAQGAGGTGEVVSLARSRAMPIAWIHAGNREAGTTDPASASVKQWTVSFENFDSPN